MGSSYEEPGLLWPPAIGVSALLRKAWALAFISLMLLELRGSTNHVENQMSVTIRLSMDTWEARLVQIYEVYGLPRMSCTT